MRKNNWYPEKHVEIFLKKILKSKLLNFLRYHMNKRASMAALWLQKILWFIFQHVILTCICMKRYPNYRNADVIGVVFKLENAPVIRNKTFIYTHRCGMLNKNLGKI